MDRQHSHTRREDPTKTIYRPSVSLGKNCIGDIRFAFGSEQNIPSDTTHDSRSNCTGSFFKQLGLPCEHKLALDMVSESTSTGKVTWFECQCHWQLSFHVRSDCPYFMLCASLWSQGRPCCLEDKPCECWRFTRGFGKPLRAHGEVDYFGLLNDVVVMFYIAYHTLATR